MATDQSNENTTKNRHSSPSQSPRPSTATSKNAAAPTTLAADVYRIIGDLVLFFCRHVIFGPPKFKILVALGIILLGSSIKKLNWAPESYFSMKTNVFNVYFVKLGWAWTIGLLAPFMYLTRLTTHSHYQIIVRHLVRLLIATGVWYVITITFVNFELYTGYCKPENMRSASKQVCRQGGHDWEEGHDFSGHVFLLLYALLIINEEVKSYDSGTKKVKEASQSAKAAGDQLSNIQHDQLQIISAVIRAVYVALAALTILWECMLLTTALYFHHTIHKITAAFVAMFFWYITYYVWYQPSSHSLLRPSSPSDSAR